MGESGPGPAVVAASPARRPLSSIAYVTTTFPTFAWFLENEVRGLRARGHRVRVFALREVGNPVHPEHVELVPITTAVGAPFAWQAWLALAGWLLRRPGVLVSGAARLLWASRSSPYALAGHLGYLPAAARVATLVERENLDLVHGAWAHFPASVAYLAARLTGRRFSMAAHAGADLHRTRAFLPEKLRAADFVAACVRGNAEMLRGLAGAGARIECIYHGVDLERFDGRDRQRDLEPMILGGGRLGPEKGYDLAIRALSDLEGRGLRAKLVLFGDGPERSRLQSLARRLGLEARVVFRGQIVQPELLELLRRAWVMVAPCRVLASGQRDGIPNVLVEALAMGVPCVGTRVGGIEEAVIPGETGALCAPDDVRGLADALAELLRSPADLDRMGALARERVRRDFDARQNLERLLALFEEPRPSSPSRPNTAHGEP